MVSATLKEISSLSPSHRYILLSDLQAPAKPATESYKDLVDALKAHWETEDGDHCAEDFKVCFCLSVSNRSVMLEGQD